MKFIETANGTVKVDFYGSDNGKALVVVVENGEWKSHKLKLYYRHERTWDDHMGNTPCGYYVNIPLSGGKKKRVYM